MKPIKNQPWTAEDLLALGRSYQGAAILCAAAELELFGAVADAGSSAAQLADRARCDLRGLTILLDALVALRLLQKRGEVYSLPAELKPLLTPDPPRSVLAMAQHQANCLRHWAQLANVVRSGRKAGRIPGVRDEAGDQEAFIGAMHNVSAPVAGEVIRAVQPLEFKQLLDIGGASGTWTIAFLEACPGGRATLFDLPAVIPLAQARLARAGMIERTQFVAGDFMTDPLPTGADLAWVSAIVHQNSRAQNRLLLGKVYKALVPGGRIAIRDILMDPPRTSPVAGALFAVNMLVATEGGGTFTLDELAQDLDRAGFSSATVARRDEGMNSVVIASKATTDKG